jgi:hypothetical protein
MSGSRLSYEESCQRLKFVDDNGVILPMPGHMPRSDDTGPLGVSFFKMFVGPDYGGGDWDLSNLTLTRTFFGRSEVNSVLFKNTDLTESNLCWNDFINVDFTDAVLAQSDLRASVFTCVRFVRTDLRGVDMRHSSFENCDFDDALLMGAVLTAEQGSKMTLSDQQCEQIAWTDEQGPEPIGG